MALPATQTCKIGSDIRPNEGAAVESRIHIVALNATDADVRGLAPILNHLAQTGLVLQNEERSHRSPDQSEDDRIIYVRHDVLLTVWSRGALLDEGVVARAVQAMKTGNLFPVRVEDVDPPLGFRQVQCYDLVNPSQEAAEDLARHLRVRLQLDLPSEVVFETRRVRGSLIVCDWTAFVGLFAAVYFCIGTICFPGFAALMRTRDWARALLALPTFATFLNAWMFGCPPVISAADGKIASSKLSARSLGDLVIQVVPLLGIGVAMAMQFQDDDGSMPVVTILGYRVERYILILVAWKPLVLALSALIGRYAVLRCYLAVCKKRSVSE